MEKRRINICLGSSCFSRGNKMNVDIIKKYLEENKLDAEIIFSGHLCENMCSRGPVISIDDKTYENVQVSLLSKILQREFPC